MSKKPRRMHPDDMEKIVETLESIHAELSDEMKRAVQEELGHLEIRVGELERLDAELRELAGNDVDAIEARLKELERRVRPADG